MHVSPYIYAFCFPLLFIQFVHVLAPLKSLYTFLYLLEPRAIIGTTAAYTKSFK
jgi:hypothetical protein